jgi:hypothetical protein
LLYSPAEVSVIEEFEPVDGGDGRVCRGTSTSDNSDTYYMLYKQIASLEDCKTLCTHAAVCTGIEYGSTSKRCEVWTQPVGTTKALDGYTCLRKKTCHTVAPGDGDTCYDAVTWAMQDGIYANPEWYDGLSTDSSFEDFQNLFHAWGEHDCPSACDPVAPVVEPGNGETGSGETATTTTTTTVPDACTAALSVVAVDPWSSYTCGQRIAWHESPSGGSKSHEQARAQIGLEYTACEPCWPWPKYKAAGDSYRSKKRGIAIQNHKLVAAMATLREAVSWGYAWTYNADTAWPQGGPSLAEWKQYGVEFLPMVWGEHQLPDAETLAQPSGMKALLGFNEPNFPDQANLSPERAAALWPRVEELARQLGVDTLVSPALNFNAYHPIDWLHRFLEVCSGCRVDAIAFHSYTCHGKYLQDHINLYRTLGKPLWLTEFACSEQGSEDRLSAQGQMAYMREAVPLLEQDPDIATYAWFSYFEDEWGYAIANGKNADAGLVNADGSLSELGELYATFASTMPEDIPEVVAPPAPAPTPAPTPAPCHTAQPGEQCYDDISWAKSSGVLEHPDWYPGLSADSSLAEFQAQLHSTGANSGACSAPC